MAWRAPCHAIHRATVSTQLENGTARSTDIENLHSVGFELECREIVRVPWIEGDAQQRHSHPTRPHSPVQRAWPFRITSAVMRHGRLRIRFVDDRRVLQVAQVEHAHTAISTHRCKDIRTPRTPINIVHFPVMRNELRKSRSCRQVPYGARCVDRRRYNEVR